MINKFPDEFKQGFRGILLIKRNKDGECGNAQRKAIKRICSNKEEWNNIIEWFDSLRQLDEFKSHRIYASLNARNMNKAIRLYKTRQLDNDYAAQNIHEWFYTDIQNTFFSCFMNPSCRETNNFLIDCDSEEEYRKAIERIPKDIILLDYATKNGRHIVTKPFNPDEIKVEVKKDELLFIG